MSQNQINQLLGKVQALETTVEALKINVVGRLSALEYCVYLLEGHAAGTLGNSVIDAPYYLSLALPAPGGPNTKHSAPYGRLQNPHQAARDHHGPPHRFHAPSPPGSSRNASHLPFAIEAIAHKHQNHRNSNSPGW